MEHPGNEPNLSDDDFQQESKCPKLRNKTPCHSTNPDCEAAANEVSQELTCRCGVTFRHRCSLVRHSTNCGLSLRKSRKCYIPGCKKQFYHETKLISHIERDHSISIGSNVLHFTSLGDFLQWKETEQMESMSTLLNIPRTQTGIFDTSRLFASMTVLKNLKGKRLEKLIAKIKKAGSKQA